MTTRDTVMPKLTNDADRNLNSGASATNPAETATRRVLGGGAILTITMLATGVGNYAINALLARWLGPEEFGDASMLVTLLLAVTAIAGCFQLVTARETSEALGRGDDTTAALVRHRVLRWALATGLALGAITTAGAAIITSAFNVGSQLAVILFGVGLPLYLWQSVYRGILQGRLAYGPMASTFVVEMLVRVAATVVLVKIGWGLDGVAFALSLSFLASLIASRVLVGPVTADRCGGSTPNLAGAVGATTVLLLAQITLNNGDLLLVKQGFRPAEAGVYAVVALLGRAVFFLSWSIVTTIFPASARADDASARRLAVGGTVLLAAGGGAATVMFWLFGDMIVEQLFSSTYAEAATLLGPYVLATSLLTMANFAATVDLAVGRLVRSRLMVVAAIVQSIAVATSDTLNQVVWSQVFIMGALLMAMAVPTLVGAQGTPGARGSAAG